MVYTLNHIAIGLRQVWVPGIAIIGGIDNDWQVGILPFDIVEQTEPLESVQTQIQKNEIRSAGEDVRDDRFSITDTGGALSLQG